MKKSKAVTFTLNENILSILKDLAEKNSSSMSHEVRRLILNEQRKEEVDKTNR